MWQQERGQERVGVGMCRQEHVYAGASVPISAGVVPRLPVYQPIAMLSPHVKSAPYLPETGGWGCRVTPRADGKFTNGKWREAQ